MAGKKVSYDALFIVPRIGDRLSVETVAIVRAKVASMELQDELPFLRHLDEAVTKWLITKGGKEAWEAASEDFNVGDLSIHLDDADLKRCLVDEMILELRIDVTDATAGNWAFDRIIGGPPPPEEES